jgi:hypothetical protein
VKLTTLLSRQGVFINITPTTFRAVLGDLDVYGYGKIDIDRDLWMSYMYIRSIVDETN